MTIYFGYQNTIFGSQSTVNGSAFDYNVGPPAGGTWSWSGSTTNFAVRENDGASQFNGDVTNEQVAAQEQFGGIGEQVVNIGGTWRQLIWDYTFEIFAPDGTVYRVAVIDVDFNNDSDLNDAGEDGYYLVFPDGVPPAGVTYTIGNIVENDSMTPHAGLGAQIVCFAEGTRIETPDGPRRVETLTEGDLVVTRDHGAQPLRWTGSRRVPALGPLAPIVIPAGRLDNDRDLVVSPQHRLLIGDWRAELLFGQTEVLVRASDLVDGDGIHRRPGGHVTYHHLLFDAHEIVYAEGCPAESLHPGPMTRSALCEEQRAEIEAIFPEIGARFEGFGPAARRSLKRHEAACLHRPTRRPARRAGIRA